MLACFACGKTTGLVADIGAGTTTVSPVVEGWLDTKGALISYKRAGSFARDGCRVLSARLPQH